MEKLLVENYHDGYRVYWDDERNCAVYRKIYKGGDHAVENKEVVPASQAQA